ncbi:MAG: S46 family peptidase [Bacteroidales bacterium]|nr:S46 family peptidase [Bacteroidales bacterium]
MKKLTLLFVAFFLLTGTHLKADEGMWLPMYVKRLNFVDMQKKGLQLTPEEIYSVNHSSLKDAIVGLANSPKPSGYFCTAEIVSDEGLMFTNHHCGYDAIQKHSSLEYDYLTDGFWAMGREEELPNEGMTASVLIYMEDLTDSIIPTLSDTLSEADRKSAVREITSRIKKRASEEGKYNVIVKSFFEGNEYYMFVYEVYLDVRLVGAPPSSVGKFGGDTDNWMWPRHTGDFSIFRIYTAPDGSPAEYAAENIPLKPKHHLPVSIDGVQENDFAMIWGFPGSTERYLTSSGVQFKVDHYFPPLIDAFGVKLDVWKQHMDADPEVKIKYASKHAGIANGWKYFIGQSKGVKDLDVVGQKEAFEAELEEWIAADENRQQKYGMVLTEIDDAYIEKSDGIEPLIYASITGIGGSDIMAYAQKFMGLKEMLKQLKEEKDNKKKAKKEEQIRNTADNMLAALSADFKNYDKATDQDVFAAMTELYFKKVPVSFHPELLDKMEKKYKGDLAAYAAYVFSNSLMADSGSAKVFLKNPSLKALDKDPAFELAQGYMQKIMPAGSEYRTKGKGLDKAERIYMQAIREMQPDKAFYPDANSTMRFTYGQVMDYIPRDAVQYDYVTHLWGVMEKEAPDNDEFYVEPKLKELFETKDYGPYAAKDGSMVVCFLTNNDITGGNSGSPVINGKGELIGLAFDGNWEAMSSDIGFIPDLQRTIVVDVRYVLFIIDKYAGAGHLVDELTISQSAPQPVRTEMKTVIEVVVD